VSPDDVATRAAEAMWAGDAASRALGMELVEVAPGRATLRMTVRADMVNGHAIGHGGLTFTLADSARQVRAPEWRTTFLTPSRTTQASGSSTSAGNGRPGTWRSALTPAASSATRARATSPASVVRRWPFTASRTSTRACLPIASMSRVCRIAASGSRWESRRTPPP
jgi:hypothetical protein